MTSRASVPPSFEPRDEMVADSPDSGSDISLGSLPTIPPLAPPVSIQPHHRQIPVSVDIPRGTLVGDRYLIERKLGQGGIGQVYLARHKVLPRQYALKVLIHAEDQGAQLRFLREAVTSGNVRHPNVVEVLDFGQFPDGNHYLVMEYLQGRPLSHAIRQGAMAPLLACRIAADIAQGLTAIHQMGVIHRDLKPENVILVGGDGHEQVKIVDFGLAKPMAGGLLSAPPEALRKLTKTGSVMGTPEYMAPEQAEGISVDHRADEYALGCILYEMLTGALPLEGPSVVSTLYKHVHELPVPPRQRRPDLPIPEVLDALVMRTLAKDREARFPTMDELERALRRI